jgi:hypothetical protein
VQAILSVRGVLNSGRPETTLKNPGKKAGCLKIKFFKDEKEKTKCH